MGNCNCLSYSPTKKQPSNKCLCAPTLRNLFKDGPEPCGGVYTVDLDEVVENTTGCTINYKILMYDDDGFKDVKLAGSVLTANLEQVVTKDTGGKEFYILYEAVCQEKDLSVLGQIYVGVPDKGLGKNCDYENCTGDCIDEVSIQNNSEVGIS